ncbi:hypothetical protein [Nocardia mangyaensis]|uniref:hypothetical protein n=1 Tax=Nocardia mangyaensis TaxID=2213200 RepID=UPI0012EC30CC|nr:hypothetical protein [Nocardia mangyaensis]
MDLAIKMMERLNTELEHEKRARVLLMEYVKDLRNNMIEAGIPVSSIPRELRDLGL